MLGFSLIAPFFIYIGLGFLAQKVHEKSDGAQDWLDSFVFYLAMPALLFQTISRAGPPSVDVMLTLSVTSVVTTALFMLTAALGRRHDQDADKAVSGLLGSYSNIGYMGPVLSVQLFGEAAGLPAAMIFCSEIIVLLSLWMLATAGASAEGLLLALVKAVRHPFVLTVAFALVLTAFGISFAGPIDVAMIGLSNAAAPCALFSLGLTLARQKGLSVSPGLTIGLVGKLVLHPVLMALCLWPVLHHQPIWLGTAILMASLPPAANVYVLAQSAGRSARLAASGVMYGTLASAITVPLVILFLTQFLIR
ncbi:AEC family transporter [Pelagibacterium sp.]|uniref:AEC family transporter n=1 Tax=Pelagibacterium sp. TaxID=1967288 RepID=UPI003A8F10C0